MSLAITANGLNWIFALATSIAFAFIGLLVPNLYKQTKTPRSHNRHKFVNEFLARHQLTYTTFFAAVVLTAEFKPGFEWVKKLFALSLALALGSYLIGVYLTVHQDDLFVNHNCMDIGYCPTSVKPREMLKMCQFNLLSSFVLAGIAVVLVLTIK